MDPGARCAGSHPATRAVTIRSLQGRDPDANYIELSTDTRGPRGLDLAAARAHAGRPMKFRAAEATP